MCLINKITFILGLILFTFPQEIRSAEFIEKKGEPVKNSKMETIRTQLLTVLDSKERQILNKALDSLDINIEDKYELKAEILEDLCMKGFLIQAHEQYLVLQDALNKTKFTKEKYEKELRRIIGCQNTISSNGEEFNECCAKLSNKMTSTEREKLSETLKNFPDSCEAGHIDAIVSLGKKKFYKDQVDQFILYDNSEHENHGSKFLKLVGMFLDNESNNGNYIDEYLRLLIALKNRKNEPTSAKNIMTLSLKTLKAIKQVKDSFLIYDRMFFVFFKTLETFAKGWEIKFIQECISSEKQDSVQVKVTYADKILMPKIISKNYNKTSLSQAIEIYKNSIKFNKFKTPSTLNFLGYLMNRSEKHEEGSTYYIQALKMVPSSYEVRKNLALSYGLNKNYPKAIEELKFALKVPNANIKEIERSLLMYYQLAEMTTEASELMEKKAQKSLFELSERRRKIVESIKLSKEKVAPKKAMDTKTEKTNDTGLSLKIKKELLQSQQYRKEAEICNPMNDNLKKEYLQQSPKGKKKTQGLPKPEIKSEKDRGDTFEKEILIEEKKEEVQTLKDLLNSNGYKTVLEIFEVLLGNKNAASAKISIDDIECLWTALGGDFDPSQGKGSHTKLTIDNEGEEQMLILSKKTYLIDYQLKNIAKILLDMGLYPKDMEETLMKKMLLRK